MAHVFTYGSLMYAPVWERVVRGEYSSALGTIHGFRRLAVKAEEYPALVIAKGAPPLEGRVYFDVSAEDISLLDTFETAQYARVSVAVNVEGTPIAADAYLFLEHDRLDTYDWDVARFEREGLARFMASYVEQHAPK